jgi:hypothetical protein
MRVFDVRKLSTQRATADGKTPDAPR